MALEGVRLLEHEECSGGKNRDGVNRCGLQLDMLVGDGLRVVAVFGGAVIMGGLSRLLTMLVAGVAWG